jgi:hypothetical protein
MLARVIFVLALLSGFANAAIMTPPRVAVVASASTRGSSGDGGGYSISNIKSSVVKSVKRVLTGFRVLIPNIKEYQKLSKIRKKQGDSFLSYSDFEKIQQGKEDFYKGLRLAFTIPLAPEFSFYSYLVSPMLAFSNPWAWRSLPSSFDSDEDDLRERARIMHERRYAGLLSSVAAFQKQMVDDHETTTRKKREDQYGLLEEALMNCQNTEKAFATLIPWMKSPLKDSKKMQLNLAWVPGAAIKDVIKALGMDGVPDLPLVRRLNVGELGRHLDKIRESDKFLAKKGVSELESDELERACFARCIYTKRRSDNDLRKELRQWLRLADGVKVAEADPDNASGPLYKLYEGKPPTGYGTMSTGSSRTQTVQTSKGPKVKKVVKSDPSKVTLNPYNRRLALMAIHVAKTGRESGLLDTVFAL